MFEASMLSDYICIYIRPDLVCYNTVPVWFLSLLRNAWSKQLLEDPLTPCRDHGPNII